MMRALIFLVPTGLVVPVDDTTQLRDRASSGPPTWLWVLMAALLLFAAWVWVLRMNAHDKIRSGGELSDGEKTALWVHDGFGGGADIAMHERLEKLQRENEHLRSQLGNGAASAEEGGSAPVTVDSDGDGVADSPAGPVVESDVDLAVEPESEK